MVSLSRFSATGCTSPYAVIPDAAKRRSGIGKLLGRLVKLPDSGFGCAAPE
jgi:hypothetical protein